MDYEALDDLKELSEKIFVELHNRRFLNKGSGKSYETKTYAVQLYNRVLKMSSSVIMLLKDEKYEVVPLIARNMIESIIDLANLRLYGDEYRRHLELSNLVKEIDFYNSSFNDYKELFALECENIQSDHTINQLKARKNGLIEEMKNHQINKLSYIRGLIKDDNTINDKELKIKFTQTMKFQLLFDKNYIENSQYKIKMTRHKRYKVCYYLMSKFIHNSIEFLPGYKPQKNLIAYVDLIASMLKNGVLYVSDIIDHRINDRDFNELRSNKIKISETAFDIN